MPKFKIAVCGSMAVGKSSLLYAMHHGAACLQDQTPTIGSNYREITITLPPPDDRTVIFAAWDTAGEEQFQAAMPIVYRGARALIAVFDISSHRSFQCMKAMLDEALRHCGTNDDPHVVVVGNKCDLADSQRDVRAQDVEVFCRERNYTYMETSARQYENVRELRECLAYQLLGPKPIVFSDSTERNELPQGRVLLTAEQAPTSPRASSCSGC